MLASTCAPKCGQTSPEGSIPHQLSLVIAGGFWWLCRKGSPGVWFLLELDHVPTYLNLCSFPVTNRGVSTDFLNLDGPAAHLGNL